VRDDKDTVITLVAKLREIGILNPWGFISDEAKDRLAFQRFLVAALKPIPGFKG
jgi:hypothetical protein